MNQKPPQAEGTCCEKCYCGGVNKHWCDSPCECHSNAETTVEPSQAVSSSSMVGEAVEPWVAEFEKGMGDGSLFRTKLDYNNMVVQSVRVRELKEFIAKTLAAERARVSESIAVEIEKGIVENPYADDHVRNLTRRHAASIARTHAKKGSL